MKNNEKPKRKTLAAIFLILLAPVMGELLSGSAPPNEFFTPFGFIVMTVLYGGGAILIREARVRWKLGWSIIFLAIAYGILEEGLLMHSFYNHNHIDLDVLTRYGMFLKTQWPWAIQLTIYHATISTLIPIMATDLLFPQLKDASLLGKKGIIATIVLLTLDTVFMSVFIIMTYRTWADPYVPSAVSLIVWTLIFFGFIYIGYRLRDKYHMEYKAKLKSPFRFFVNGFFFVPLVVITPYILANNNVPAIITIAVLLAFAYLVIRFAFRQMYHVDADARRKVFLFAGVITSFSLLAIFNHFVNGAPGMAQTGIVGFVLMVVYCVVVLRKEEVISNKE